MKTVLTSAITHCVVVIPYRRFGTTYRSHLQWCKIWTNEDGVDSLSGLLKIRPIVGCETSVGNYRYALHNRLEERSSQV